MTQGSEEWFAAKLGVVSCSRLIDIVKGRSGYRASRENYIAEKVCERLTGARQESFTSSAMQWGTDTEPLARSAYEAVMEVMVQEVGFIKHPDIEGFGGSPDGLVADDGGVEIKAPNTSTHLDTLMRGTVKKDYVYQMNGCMMVTGRAWWDFVSYDPRLPDEHALYIKRFERDDNICDEILAEVGSVLVEIEHMIDKLNARIQ